MRTREFILGLVITNCAALSLGWTGGRMIDNSRDYGLAEKFASTLNKEAENTGAWPQGDSPLFQGREKLTDSKGQTVLIINDRYKLRLRTGSNVAQIELNRHQGK